MKCTPAVMNAAWLLFGCNTANHWSEADVLAPHLTRPDINRDGSISPEEYARVAWAAPAFQSVDLDQNGGLDMGEMRRLVESQSPTTFDGTVVEPPAPPGRGSDQAMNIQQRHVWEFVVAVADESRRVYGPVTSPTALRAAVTSGTLHSPESKLVLDPLRVTFDQQRWTWPRPQ